MIYEKLAGEHLPPSPPVATVLKSLNVWTCEKLTFHLVFIYHKTEHFYTKHFLTNSIAEVLKLWKISSESIQMGV